MDDSVRCVSVHPGVRRRFLLIYFQVRSPESSACVSGLLDHVSCNGGCRDQLQVLLLCWRLRLKRWSEVKGGALVREADECCDRGVPARLSRIVPLSPSLCELQLLFLASLFWLLPLFLECLIYIVPSLFSPLSPAITHHFIFLRKEQLWKSSRTLFKWDISTGAGWFGALWGG